MILDGRQRVSEANVFETVREMEMNKKIEGLEKENEELKSLSRNLFKSITRMIDACGGYKWTREVLKRTYTDNVDDYKKLMQQ